MHNIRLLLLLMALLPAGSFLTAQDLSPKEQRQLMKQLREEEQAKELARNAELVGLMLGHRRFVLEAEQLRDGRGNLAEVSSIINFIAADSTRGTIQVGNNTSMGLNGVGGITVEGLLSNFETRYNVKRGTYYVTYDVVTSAGTYHVAMTANPTGRADATISSNWAGRLTYVGRLVPPGASRVYKGTPY